MKTELGMGARSSARLLGAGPHGREPHGTALRIKSGGAWRTWVWSQVEHLAAALTLSRDAEEGAHAGPGPVSAWDLGDGDEVLVLGDAAVPRAWALGWMREGFVLSL
ncbi:MAG TPA: hypothetical protein VIU64_13095, partial [Polyangia bacterium]